MLKQNIDQLICESHLAGILVKKENRENIFSISLYFVFFFVITVLYIYFQFNLYLILFLLLLIINL